MPESATHPGETHDTTVIKVQSRHSPTGPQGQKYLACGVRLAMRLWTDEPPDRDKPESIRQYETVGYVLSGRAELHVEGQTIVLEPGDCWVVPDGARHRYRIIEPFTAIEATSPPYFVHARDEGS